MERKVKKNVSWRNPLCEEIPIDENYFINGIDLINTFRNINRMRVHPSATDKILKKLNKWENQIFDMIKDIYNKKN